MNANTFTIQSVHGMTETFVVNPNGTVDTSQPHTNRESDGDRPLSLDQGKNERLSAK